MEWYNALSFLPKDKQKVLISIKGVYYVAEFNEAKQIFKVADELRETFFNVSELVYWQEFEELGPEKHSRKM